MAFKTTPFLMFQGFAEDAMRLYTAAFRNAEVKSLEYYDPGETGSDGSVKRAHFSIAGQDIICIDSPVENDFMFPPATLFVECEDEAEFDAAFRTLSLGGAVLMPPSCYESSRKFTWLSDRYGTSWQLNLQ